MRPATITSFFLTMALSGVAQADCTCDPKHPDHCCPKDPDEQWALVVGVNQYGSAPGQSVARGGGSSAASAGPAIHGGDDARAVRQILESSQWKRSNVKLLVDEQATATAIRRSGLEWLNNKVKLGDSVFVYLSGLGTKIPDDNGDEADGQDEAFVPVDGLGDPSHALLIRDDEIATWMRKIQQKVRGQDGRSPGSVLLLMDVGFGSASVNTRSKGSAPIWRSVVLPTQAPRSALNAAAGKDGNTEILTASEAQALQGVVITAARPGSPVREVVGEDGQSHGPLAWGLQQVLKGQPAAAMTYGELYRRITDQLAPLGISGAPQIDGTADARAQNSISLGLLGAH